MAFPSSPTNGQVAILNGVSYTYNSTLGVWTRTQASTANASIMLTSGGTFSGGVTFNSTASFNGSSISVPTGTATTPGLNFSNATGTGLYMQGLNGNLGIATYGSNAVWVDWTQKVGIGTTTPAAQLHLNATGYAAIYLGNNASTGFHVTKETTDNSFNIWSGTFGAGTNRFKIDSTGNLGVSGSTGIGTTSPLKTLDVYGASFGVRGSANYGIAPSLDTTFPGSPVSARLSFGTDNTGWQMRFAKNVSGSYTDYMTLTDSGLVGIGTSSPIRQLHLNNNSSVVEMSLTGNTTTGNAFINVSDNVGSNGGGYVLNIRGLGSSGTAGVNLSSFAISANATTMSGTVNASASLIPGVPSQMVYVRADGKTTYSVATAGSAGTYITDLNATITPRLSTSKVLVTYCITFECINDSVFKLYRSVGGTDTLIGQNANDTNYWSGTWMPGYDADNSSTPRTNQMSYLDTPSTTSAITYKLMIQSGGSGAFTFYQNRAIGAAGQQNYEVGISQVFLQEIPA